MLIKMKFKSPTDPKIFAKVLNELAKYSEANEPPPDHWTDDNRMDFYVKVFSNLTAKAHEMIAKLDIL